MKMAAVLKVLKLNKTTMRMEFVKDDMKARWMENRGRHGGIRKTAYNIVLFLC